MILPQWSTACPDWERRILARESLIPAPLFPDEADASLAVLRELRLKDVAGGPTMGEVCRPWFFEFSAAIFGAYDAESGRRHINEFLLLISKKNTKSTGAAGIMLTALLRNWREEAEFLILAPTVEVANAAYKPAASMIRMDAELNDLMDVRDYQRTIRHKGNGATLRVVAADTETVSGNKATGVLIDELWLFGQRAHADSMLVEATGGLASRPEGFVIYLSTQSDKAPAGIFKQKLDYARNVRDGKVVDRKFLPVLYEFPEQLLIEEKYKDPAYFYVTNPNLGASVDAEFIAGKLERALLGAESLQDVLAKHLNVEIGTRIRTDGWAGAEFWAAQGDPTLTFEALLTRCEVIVFGVDGGGLDDLFGLCAAGRERKTGRWLFWHHAWAHEIALLRRKEIAPRLRGFAADKEVTIVKLPGVDVREVADLICRARDAGLLPEKQAIGVDTAGIGDVIDELLTPERKITMEQIIGVGQGWKLNGSIKTTERKLAGGEVSHGGTKLMEWCVGNAKVEQGKTAVSISKQASGTAKIDPLMAMFNAVSLLMLNPTANAPQKFQLLFV